MLYYKACPRCRGDLQYREDQFGPFVQCIQCGYIKDASPVAVEQQPPAVRRGRRAKAA
jgi:Zn ribbon nucleic-acid-binding protein